MEDFMCDDPVFNEIPEENISIILNALRGGNDWPNNFILHEFIMVMMQYNKKGAKFTHSLYLRGDPGDGIYLNRVSMMLPSGRKDVFYVYTANNDLTDLWEALIDTKIVSWLLGNFQFLMVHERLYPTVLGVFEAKGLQFEAVPNNVWWLPPDVPLPASHRQLQDDVFINFLTESHVDQINSNWEHKFPGSDLFLREHLLRNFGIGAFSSDGSLLCSAISNFTGGVTSLYSAPEARGRGFAQAIVQRMADELRHRGRVPHCTIVLGNIASERLFTKCGFQRFVRTTWMVCKAWKSAAGDNNAMQKTLPNVQGS